MFISNGFKLFCCLVNTGIPWISRWRVPLCMSTCNLSSCLQQVISRITYWLETKQHLHNWNTAGVILIIKGNVASIIYISQKEINASFLFHLSHKTGVIKVEYMKWMRKFPSYFGLTVTHWFSAKHMVMHAILGACLRYIKLFGFIEIGNGSHWNLNLKSTDDTN